MIVAVLAVTPHATAVAAPKKVFLTDVDAGVFTFVSQTSAQVNGDGFEKHHVHGWFYSAVGWLVR